ncbi:hypothetical protein LB505_005001 [Fusarium chuoi]|nr:hypothetical protein LB505_005001 [Fusarium chuoi]
MAHVPPPLNPLSRYRKLRSQAKEASPDILPAAIGGPSRTPHLSSQRRIQRTAMMLLPRIYRHQKLTSSLSMQNGPSKPVQVRP